MRARNGFVSNSSSSSFIVIGEGPKELAYCEDGIYVIGRNGETEFDWGPDEVCDLDSRVNFAWLQAHDDSERLEMLIRVLMKQINIVNTKCILTTSWIEAKNDPEKKSGWIDHQSAACEGMNLEMFDSEDALERFLFCVDSKIVLDNDNH